MGLDITSQSFTLDAGAVLGEIRQVASSGGVEQGSLLVVMAPGIEDANRKKICAAADAVSTSAATAPVRVVQAKPMDVRTVIEQLLGQGVG